MSKGMIYHFNYAWLISPSLKKNISKFWKDYLRTPAGKESTCNAGDLTSIPGLGRSPGEGKGYPLQYSSLENSMNCIVHRVTKSWTWLNDFHFTSLHIWEQRRIFYVKIKLHKHLRNSNCDLHPIKGIFTYYK